MEHHSLSNHYFIFLAITPNAKIASSVTEDGKGTGTVHLVLHNVFFVGGLEYGQGLQNNVFQTIQDF